MEPKNFIRNPEDFICEHCDASVAGNGYTNHCPACLYSKHVDNIPGDRANPCCGLMPPLRVEPDAEGYTITHQCQICRAIKRNKAAANDNRDRLISLINA